jgi:hypothetical protein
MNRNHALGFTGERDFVGAREVAMQVSDDTTSANEIWFKDLIDLMRDVDGFGRKGLNAFRKKRLAIHHTAMYQSPREAR